MTLSNLPYTANVVAHEMGWLLLCIQKFMSRSRHNINLSCFFYQFTTLVVTTTVITAALILQTADLFVLFILMASSAKTSVLLMGIKSVLQHNIMDTFSQI